MPIIKDREKLVGLWNMISFSNKEWKIFTGILSVMLHQPAKCTACITETPSPEGYIYVLKYLYLCNLTRVIQTAVEVYQFEIKFLL